MTKSKHIAKPFHIWTPAELDTLRAMYPDTRTSVIAAQLGIKLSVVYRRAAYMGLRKSDAYYADGSNGRLAPGTAKGRDTRFQPGLVPWNKGLKGFKAGGRSAETRFKKGEMWGAAQHNYLPIGTLRLSKDGYLERKVTDDRNIAPARRWVGVHRLVWQAAHGPIPKSHAVVFLPGRFTNELEKLTLDRLELITRRELLRRNSYHTNYPTEVRSLVHLKGQITRQVNRINREATQ